MPVEWEDDNGAREPDESYNPFAPIDYAARLKPAPRHEGGSASRLPPRPGQLYGTDRWLSPPKPLVPSVESDPWSGRFESNFAPARPASAPPAAPQIPPYLKRTALSHDAPVEPQPTAPQSSAWERKIESPSPETFMPPPMPEAPVWDEPTPPASKEKDPETASAAPAVEKPARRRRRSERFRDAIPSEGAEAPVKERLPDSPGGTEPETTDAFRSEFNPYVEMEQEPPTANSALFPSIGEPGSPYPAFFPTEVKPVETVETPETPTPPFDEIAAFFSSDTEEETDEDAEAAKAFDEAVKEIELPPIPPRPEPVWRDPFEPAAPKEEPYTPPPFSVEPQREPSAQTWTEPAAKTPPKEQKPAEKATEPQQASAQPERPPIRVWRVAALISAAAMLIFCAIVGGRILLKLSSNEREMKAVREEWQSVMGTDPRSDASRVELLPAGQTYEPIASPTPTAVIETPTPTPVIPINEAAIQSLNKRGTGNVQETPEPTPTPVLRTKIVDYPDNPLRNEMESLRELREESSEVVGRLVIEGVLDEVVVQRNNTYYLTHNYRGVSSNAGAVFIDESCSLRNPPENLLLRGQGGVSGKSFEPLWQYKTGGQAFAALHPTLSLTTLYEEADYLLIAVIVADSDPTSSGYFNYASHPTFPTDEEMLSYVESARAHSLYQFNVDVQASDRLLTLATLDTSGSSLVLVLRMTREDGR